MAYVKGEWLDWDARQKYIYELEDEKNLLRKLVENNLEVYQDLLRLEEVLNELERVKRIHRGEKDVAYFGLMYFSEDGNEGNPDNLVPKGVDEHNMVGFHKDLCGLLNDISSAKQNKNVAWACPRQHAKTAWGSNIFPIHQVVYRLKGYIVLFSETTDVAGDFISWGRYQLKLNEKLREDFGELLHVSPSKNQSDNKYEYITTTNVKVEAKGLQVQTRGLRHGSKRPDMFILDDLESKATTNTPELIEKSKAWFREEMLPAIGREGIVVYLGTILAYGSLLHYVLEERQDFESRRFGAIQKFSEREDLWKEWRALYKNKEVTVSEAADIAREFYLDNEEEMLKGTEILWDGYWSYYDLMEILMNNGAKTFNQEYQNNPTDEERQIFALDDFSKYKKADIDNHPLTFYAGVDIAMGKATGDYSVIVTIAKSELTGRLYIYDVFMERVHPDILIDKIIEYTLKYQYEALGIEAQFAQEYIADILIERLQDEGYPAHTRVQKIKQNKNKAVRIEMLLPTIKRGEIIFRENEDPVMMAQFEMYPMHEHDDFPDAVEMAYRTAVGGQTYIKVSSKRTR